MANITGRLTGDYGRSADNNNRLKDDRTPAVGKLPLANMSPEIKGGLPPSGNRVEQGIRGIFQGRSPKVMQFQAKLNGYEATRGVKARDLALETVISELELDCNSNSNNRMTPSERSEAIQLVRKKLPSSLDTAEGRQAAQGTKVALARRLDALESINSAQAIKDIDGPQQLEEFNKALARAATAGQSHISAVFPPLSASIASLRPEDQGRALAGLAPLLGEVDSSQQFAEFTKALPLVTNAGERDKSAVFSALAATVSSLKLRTAQVAALTALAPSLSSMKGQEQERALRSYFDATMKLPLGPGRAQAAAAALTAVTSCNARECLPALTLLKANAMAVIGSAPVGSGTAPDLDSALKTASGRFNANITPGEAYLVLAPLVESLPNMNSNQQRTTIGLAKQAIGKFSPNDQAAMLDGIASGLASTQNCDRGAIKAFAELMPSLKDEIVGKLTVSGIGDLPLSVKFKHYLQIASLKPQLIDVLADLSVHLSDAEKGLARLGYKRTLGSFSDEQFEAHIQPLSAPRQAAARALREEAKKELASHG